MADNISLPPTTSAEDMPPNVNPGDALCIMTWVLLGVSTVLVGARMISKAFVLRRLRLDDVFMLLTWICAVAYSGCIQASYHWGLGRHSVYLAIPNALQLLKCAYVCQMFCILTPMFGRISVNLYTLALLGKTKPVLRYSLWVLLVTQTVFNVTICITLISVCGTDMTIIGNPATTCYRQSPWSRYAKFVGAFNAFTDGALTLAPVFLIFGLRTTTRAKIAACSLLGLSSLAMVAAIWRTLEIDKIFAQNWDFTHEAISYFYASSFEQCTIMIIACVPSLGPIVQRLRNKPSSTFSSGSGSVTAVNSPSASRHSSSDSVQLQKTLAHALGIHMPGLGNSVTISAGKDRKDSRDSVMPLSEIKTTTRTDVKVESVPAYSIRSGGGGDEDVETLFSMPKVQSREGK